MKKISEIQKKTFTGVQVIRLHKIYIGIILVMVIGFLWILHHYGVAHTVVKDVSGGQIIITDKKSFMQLLLFFAKWLASTFGVFIGIYAGYSTFIKPKFLGGKK